MWINPATGQMARTHSDIRTLNPNWSGPADISDEMIADLGFAAVRATQPVFDPLSQTATEVVPVLSAAGGWVQQWTVTNLPADQAKANLAAAIQAKITEIDAACLAANYSTFPFKDHLITCDPLSRSYIDGSNGYIALHNAMPPGWPGVWKTTVPGVYVPMATVDDWKNLYAAMYAQGNVNFMHSEMLKAQLVKATTSDQINAIQWSTKAA